MKKIFDIMNTICWIVLMLCVVAGFFTVAYKHTMEVRFIKQVIEQIEQEQEIDFTQDNKKKVNV